MEYIDKEVYFHIYCPMCVEKDTPEAEEPCFSCLESEVNEQSHIPVKFKPKDKDEFEKFLQKVKDIQDRGLNCCALRPGECYAPNYRNQCKVVEKK